MPLAPGHWAVPDNATPTRLAKDANALSRPDGAVLRAAPGNTAGGPLANGRSLALPGSKDCNRGSATPSDARGRRRIIVSPPQVIARQPAGTAFGSDGIALRHVLHGASWGRRCFGYAEHGASRRTLPRRSLGQDRTCHAGYEVVKVKRHSLLRAKIVEDRLDDQTLFFG